MDLSDVTVIGLTFSGGIHGHQLSDYIYIYSVTGPLLSLCYI